MRYLAVEQEQHLFTDDLGCHLALGLVGYHVLGEELRAFERKLVDLLHQDIQILARACGHRYDCVKLVACRVGRNDGKQVFVLDRVGLIDDQNGRDTGLLDLRDELFLGCADVWDGLDDECGHVDLGHRILDHLDHVIAQARARLVQAGGIQKDVLTAVLVEQAGDAGTGGLGLVGHDGHLAANQLIGQGGFAYVGSSNHGDNRGFCNFHLSFPSKSKNKPERTGR